MVTKEVKKLNEMYHFPNNVSETTHLMYGNLTLFF